MAIASTIAFNFYLEMILFLTHKSVVDDREVEPLISLNLKSNCGAKEYKGSWFNCISLTDGVPICTESIIL